MSTFNDTIRRQLGFGLISWNMQETRPSMSLSQPQPGKPARATVSTETASPSTALAGPPAHPS